MTDIPEDIMAEARGIEFDFDCDWTADGRRRGEAERQAAINVIARALMGHEAAMRQERDDARASYANLINIIADIREKSGVGATPMLGELADAIEARIAAAEQRGAERERERCAKEAEEVGEAYGEDETGWFECSETIAAAIRRGEG